MPVYFPSMWFAYFSINFCVACEAWRHIGITLSVVCLSVCLSVRPSVTLTELCFAGDTCIPRNAATIFKMYVSKEWKYVTLQRSNTCCVLSIINYVLWSDAYNGNLYNIVTWNSDHLCLVRHISIDSLCVTLIFQMMIIWRMKIFLCEKRTNQKFWRSRSFSHGTAHSLVFTSMQEGS